MNNRIALSQLPQTTLFRKGDVFVLFGELFGRGYASGLVNEARQAGLEIVGITVGRRDENNALRPLNYEELALHPSIKRQPVMPRVVLDMPAPPLPLDAWSVEGHRFDAALSGQRYELVNAIFDELVTEPLVNFQRLWLSFSALAPLAPRGAPAADELSAIARLAVEPPESVLALGHLDTAPRLRRIPPGAPVPGEQAQLIDAIRAGAEARRREVEARLDQLANRLSAGGA